VPDSSSDSGTSRATGTPTENGASMDGRDWVFSGGVGAEEAAAPANAILDTEASHRDLSATCKAWGGFQVLQKLQQGAQPLCSGASSVKAYSATLTNRERPFQMVLLQNASFTSNGIGAACVPNESYLKNRPTILTGSQYVSTRLFEAIQLQEPQRVCANPSGVLLLVSANDYWNWWWFLVQLQNAFIALAVVQPELDPGPRTIMFLEKDNREDQATYGRSAKQPLPFRELYFHLFAAQNTPDIRWFVNPSLAFGCYRSIVFLRNAESGSPILKNTAHPFASCFSPVITALVAYIKASVNLPSIAPPATPTVCWMSRDENVRPEYTVWQKARTIKDQAGLVSELDKLAATRGARVMQLAFYGNHSSVSISEQLHRASRCSLITGMHGAGLYAAVAMKAPAILEFTTQRIPNRNAYNLMSHIGGCYQGMEIVAKDKVNGTLNPLQVWPKVVQALEKCGVIAPAAAAQEHRGG